MKTSATKAKKRVARSASGKLPTFRGQGLQPGVDLNDGAALLGLMEGDRDTELRELAKRS